MNQTCSQCVVRYYCGGGCRGETYYQTKDIKAPYPFCADMKKAIIDAFFKVSEKASFFARGVKSYEELKNRFVYFMEEK